MFQIKMSKDKDLTEILAKVIEPFEPMLRSRKLSVYFAKLRKINYNINTDWSKYQLVLFNIFQNAVKYNKFMG